MKEVFSIEQLLLRNQELEDRLEQAEQLIDAIKSGEVDAFALKQGDKSEIFTLQSGDYAYRVLVENFREGALNITESGLIVYTNNYFLELTSTPYDKVVGRSIHDFIHADSVTVFNDLLKKGLTGQSKGEIVMCTGQRQIPVYISLTSLRPMLDTVGMIITDLSAQKKQETLLDQKDGELKQSEEKFQRLFFLSPVSITVSDADTGIVQMANDQFFRTFGYSRNEIIGKNVEEIGLMDQRTRETIVHELKDNNSVRNKEIVLKRKSGEVFSVLISAELLQIGSKQYYLGVYNDITQRKQAEEAIARSNKELIRLNKELQSFAYISSHDLQEPLRKIQTFASRIIDKEHQNLSERGKEHFERMQVAARRMQTLIDDLLAYSRTAITSGTFVKTSLKKVIEDVVEDFKEDLEEKHGTIDSTRLCDARVIPFQFRQLMHNLIGNALKFSKPASPPHIKITSEIEAGKKLAHRDLLPDTKYCHITVTDNGIGFESQYNEKIFDVFQRLHSRASYQGTGIGLAIVKRIVENHGGVITASAVPNEGATFDIYIPND